ncbi:MAG: DDE-type integrase/transposase/recombinase [Oscillochloris sp.]|nr:DDE-type integrase/transposase/recombinase [Oscillochloris sp.]
MVLTDDQVRALCARLGCPPQALAVISAVQQSPPARRVQSRAGNVSVRYPSRKMGVVIQAESHRNELAAIYAMEHDPATLAFYDQPPSIKLVYRGRHGRQLGIFHTPDFFVLRTTGIGWEEWKLEADLLRLADTMPGRYERDSNGQWRCPPGEAYAAPFGFTYRVCSSASINWVLQRNLLFLADYLHPECPDVDPQLATAIQTMVAQQPGVLLAQLLALLPPGSADAVYTLLAREHLFVELGQTPLAEPSRVALFTSPAAAQLSPLTASVRGPDLDRPTSAAAAHLLSASPAALTEAHRRFMLLTAFREGQSPPGMPPGRTLRRWSAAYQHAEATFGMGFVGLLPRTQLRGNRAPKLPPTTQHLLDEAITKRYETTTAPHLAAVYAELLHRCAEHGVPAPSYKTLAQAARRRPQHAQQLARRGPRAAYGQEPCYWELSLTTPRHGDRPWEVTHLDHTELEVQLVCSRTGQPLGRPWLTLLLDAFSRRVLALSLSFDPPSYRACMQVLRCCVQRHHRLPQTLVVDGGPEFASIYLETLLAQYEVTKKTRPVAKPRFGAVLERLFGTSQTSLIHNLAGNTQLAVSGRLLTPAVDPQRHAVWTLAALHQAFGRWAYEVYDTTAHPALGQSPRAAWAQGEASSGQRAHRQIQDDLLFQLATLPTTSKGTAIVQPNQGVKIHHLYYWADAFRDPQVERQAVPIRYDPDDMGVAYAFVQARWVRCLSEQYAALAGRSEREVALATAELRARASQHERHRAVNARTLGAFLVSLEAEEQLLAQRLRDLAKRELTAGQGEVMPPAVGGGQPIPQTVEPSPPQPLQPYEVDP